MTRKRLPPGVRQVQLKSGAIRYEVIVDAGVDPVTDKRRQTRKRFDSLEAANKARSKIMTEVDAGSYVTRTSRTVEQVCADYLNGRHLLRPTSRAKLEYDLALFRSRHGAKNVQSITKGHIDALVRDLKTGGTITPANRVRRPWSPSAVNKTILAIAQVLEDARRQGFVTRNVAAHVDRVEMNAVEMETYTPGQVAQLLAAADRDRLGHAWHLALCGLRRGEVAGLRWKDIDMNANTLTVRNNRTSAGGKTVEGRPKSVTSERTLPMTEKVRGALEVARTRQKRERLAAGEAYGDGSYVVSNALGHPYNPAVLSRYWREVTVAAGLPPIRLHDARHTAATAMHLQGVPIAVIAQWIGHKDASFTMRLYAHSQHEALKSVVDLLNRAE